MSNFIEDLENLDDEEIKATKVLNGIVAGDKVYTEKEVEELKNEIEKLKNGIKKIIKIYGDNSFFYDIRDDLENLLGSE